MFFVDFFLLLCACVFYCFVFCSFVSVCFFFVGRRVWEEKFALFDCILYLFLFRLYLFINSFFIVYSSVLFLPFYFFFCFRVCFCLFFNFFCLFFIVCSGFFIVFVYFRLISWSYCFAFVFVAFIYLFIYACFFYCLFICLFISCSSWTWREALSKTESFKKRKKKYTEIRFRVGWLVNIASFSDWMSEEKQKNNGKETKDT